jgi:hypothetical protein
MKRRAFLFGVATGLAIGTPAMAESVVESIVGQLKNLGFNGIVQERTLLGRVRITALRKDGQREIIVNPNTGEILRDLWMPENGDDGLTIVDDRGGRNGGDDGKDDGTHGGTEDNGGSGSGGGDGGGSGGGGGDGNERD